MAVSKAKLDRALNPTTVAVVGAKKANGFNWLRNMSDLQGKLYSVHVNPDHGEEIQKELNKKQIFLTQELKKTEYKNKLLSDNLNFDFVDTLIRDKLKFGHKEEILIKLND